ncbi:hypothetical protein BaRGS_00014943, partial [Batillaria attramentaria]
CHREPINADDEVLMNTNSSAVTKQAPSSSKIPLLCCRDLGPTSAGLVSFVINKPVLGDSSRAAVLPDTDVWAQLSALYTCQVLAPQVQRPQRGHGISALSVRASPVLPVAGDSLPPCKGLGPPVTGLTSPCHARPSGPG